MKTKHCAVQLKAGPDDGLSEGQFTAYASVFGNVDSYGDVVMPGAFTEALAKWAASSAFLPVLFGHNMTDPDFNIGHVISAVEDEHGLLITAQLDLTSAKALQTYKLLKGRRINQMSFAYDVLDGAWIEQTVDGEKAEYYELRRLDLYEVSVVTIGANQETEILAVKMAVDAAQHLGAGVKEGRVLAQKHINSLRAAQEAIGAVIVAAEGDQQDKASGTGPADDEEPAGAKSLEPSRTPSAVGLVDLELQLLALTVAQEGVSS